MRDVLVEVGATGVRAAGVLLVSGDERLAGLTLTMGLWMLGLVLKHQ